MRRRRAQAVRVTLSLLTVSAAFLAAAWLGGTPPFEGRAYDPYAEQSVVRAIPFDAPLPFDMSIVTAGRGDDLAYHAQWTSALSAQEVHAQFREHLAGSPKWRLTQDPPLTDTFTTTLVRVGADGYMTHFGRLTLSSAQGQTIVTFDFTPVPVLLAPD